MRSLQRLFGDSPAVAGLAAEASVAALLPPEASYASAGAVAIVPDAAQFNGGPPGEGAYGRDLGWLPEGQEPALLARTASTLLVVTEQGIRWEKGLDQLVAIDAHRRGGFLVFVRDGTGLAVSVQTPVRIPAGSPLRTVGRVTNQFAGWDTELDVPHHW